MKNILVPTDFSLSAQYGAEFALSLSQLIDGRVTFLHVIQLIPDTAIAITIPESTWTEAKTEMETFKKNVCLPYESYTINACETKISYGEVSSTIIETAKELKADFIVMGNVGHSRVFEKIFGSQTLNVVKYAHCPVWVIPTKIELDKIKSMIYATDLEGDEVELMNKLVSISELTGANLKAVHIQEELEPEVFSSGEIIAGIKRHLKDKSIVFKNLRREDTIKGIDTYIKNQKPDVIVVAREEKGFFENLFHTSVSKHIILFAKIPVLVLQKKMEIDE